MEIDCKRKSEIISIVINNRTKVVERYTNLTHELQDYSRSRMGYPYIGPVKGYYTDDAWIRDDQKGELLIDNSVLGIVPDSIAATYESVVLFV